MAGSMATAVAQLVHLTEGAATLDSLFTSLGTCTRQLIQCDAAEVFTVGGGGLLLPAHCHAGPVSAA